MLVLCYQYFGTNGDDGLELMWKVGPIPIQDGLGKEVSVAVVSDVGPSINNEGCDFRTDSNGRDNVCRRRDWNPWHGPIAEPIAGNFYPVTTAMSLDPDEVGSTLGLATDRAQGGASLNTGELELMVHRRILADDGKGVGEVSKGMGASKGLHAHTSSSPSLDDRIDLTDRIASPPPPSPSPYFFLGSSLAFACVCSLPRIPWAFVRLVCISHAANQCHTPFLLCV